jgi:hypothetical protein
MFRKQTDKLTLSPAKSFEESCEGSLVGLDADIPGGKYDSSLKNGAEEVEVLDNVA